MASTLIPTAEIEELVKSGLPDRALERHIDAADQSIIDLYGAHTGERTVTVRSVRHMRRRHRRSGYGGYGSSYGYGYGYGYGAPYGYSQEQLQVYLPYPYAQTVAEVKEYEQHETASDAETVDSDKYELDLGGSVLRRINDYWDIYVQIRYTPIDDTDRRVLLLADLVKLSTVYDATGRTSVGPGGSGVSVQHLDYEMERKRILHRLMPNRLGSAIA